MIAQSESAGNPCRALAWLIHVQMLILCSTYLNMKVHTGSEVGKSVLYA